MENKKYVLCRSKFILPLRDYSNTACFQDGYILTQGDKIKDLGPYNPQIGKHLIDTLGPELKIIGSKQKNDIPCLNGVILPAFVKAHGHDHEQGIIGIAKDRPLTSWLDNAVNPFTRYLHLNQKKLTHILGLSPYYLIYLAARVCDIHYGITASMVHHCNHNKYHAKELALANEVAGTKMIVAIGGQDRNYFNEILDTPQMAIKRLNDTLELDDLTSTTFCPGPDQIFSNSKEMLKPLKEWARSHNTLFHIHSSEEAKTTAWFQKEVEPGMTPVQFAESIQILDQDTVLAHQVNCGPKDVEILAKHKCRVVHNPLANTILGSGMPPIIEMLEAGVPVAISTDGSGSSDNQNIVAAARLAAQYQKAFHQDATLLKAVDLLEMITKIPAKFLNFNQGELAKGLSADWVLFSLEKPNMIPTRSDNLIQNIIWASDGHEIDTVLAQGKILKERGEILPFKDGHKAKDIMDTLAELSKLFVQYQKEAPSLHGTGVPATGQSHLNPHLRS